MRWTGEHADAVADLRIDEFEGVPEPPPDRPTDETQDPEEETA